MLAGVKNVAWSAAIAMAGIVAVALADSVWIILFLDARPFFFDPRDLGVVFGDQLWISPEGSLGNTESILALAVAIWLIAYAARRVSRTTSIRRS